jgi:prepilin-type N-terminal cleavage/methylation domain-containing protein
MFRKKAFTLVELLVVIAIIAVLMAILMPALNRVKDQAKTIVCRSNLKNLSLAWNMYGDDNGGYICQGENDTASNPSDQKNPFSWIGPPIATSDPDYVTGMTNIEREQEGIKDGMLWPYAKNIDIYHCPADKLALEQTNLANAFTTYAIPAGMNGRHDQYVSSSTNMNKPIENYLEIIRPAEKYIFVEENNAGGKNWGSWVLNPYGDSWWDPMDIYHNKKACLGFADGHADIVQWFDESTIFMAETQTQGVTPGPNEGRDLEFMQKGYALKGR